MGSQQPAEAKELVVLVTGFLPFRPQWPVNSSWEIARSLPSHLPGSTDSVRVRILVHPEPLRVNYKEVREAVPGIWERAREQGVHFVVHMGMSGPRPFYQLERRAHGCGYKIPDVDGHTPVYDDEDWDALPDELVSGLDIEDVYRRWKTYCSKDMDLRVSDDPGRFLCDWIYYCSLAHLVKTDRPRKVCFLHVPAAASESAIAQGRELALNLIRSIAESETDAASETEKQ